MIARTVCLLTFASTSLALAGGPPTIERMADGTLLVNGRVPGVEPPMRAVDGGVEIGLAFRIAQSFGDIGGGMDADQLIGGGSEAALQIGHRLTPHFALAFYATGQAFTSGSGLGRDVYTGSAGIAADFHLSPGRTTDPWISLGGGVRGLLVDADGTSITVGAELARLQLGVDFRLTEDVAVGPVIGASASLYGAEKAPMREFEELTDKGINWTLSAGFAGRFNLGGTRR